MSGIPKCHYCGKPRAGVTIDHIVPKALGGPNLPWNRIMACQPCNGGKADSWPTCPCDWCDRARRLFKQHKRHLQRQQRQAEREQQKLAEQIRAEGIGCSQFVDESATVVP